MRIAAMVLGLIGGIVGMFVGFFGYGFAELWSWLASQAQSVEMQTGLPVAESAGDPEEPWLTRALALVSPILGITGGAMATSLKWPAAAFMAASAGGMFWGFGFGVFTMFPIAMCALGSLLAALAGSGDDTRGSTGPAGS